MAYIRKHRIAVAKERDNAPLMRFEDMMPVTLWQTHFKLYEEGNRAQCEDPDTCDREGEPPSQEASRRNFAIGYRPIAGAYVVCVPLDDPLAMSSLKPDISNAVFGRTNDAGWIVRRARADVGSEDQVPKSPYEPAVPDEDWPLRKDPSPLLKYGSAPRDRSTFYAPSGSTWKIFWTCSRDHFGRFCSELEADAAGALEAWDVPSHTLAPAAPPREHPALRLLPKGSLRAYYVDCCLLRGNEGKFLNAFKKAARHRNQGQRTITAAILNATPRSFWALYFSEWLSWYCERVVQDNAHWPYLWRLLSVISAAEDAAPFPDLERMMPEAGRVGEAAHAMRDYIYAIVKAGWRGAFDVREAVEHITVTHDAWRRSAKTIFESTGIRHPAEDEPNLDRFFFAPETVDALIAYYHMYALGFGSHGDAGPIRKHWEHVEQALGWVRAQQVKLLERLGHTALLRDVDVHLPPEARVARLSTINRYHHQCACLGVPFWEAADAELRAEDAWRRLQPFLAWLGELGDLATDVFEDALAYYLRVYRLAPQRMEGLVNYLFRYHGHLQRKAVPYTLPQARGVVRLELDPGSGRVIAQLWQGQKKKLLGEFEFLTEVRKTSDQDALHAPVRTRAQRKRLQRALKRGEIRTFTLAQAELDVPNAEALEGFGKELALAAAVLRAAVVVTDLIEELRQNPPGQVPFDAYFAVAEETLQGVGPTVELIDYALRKSRVAEGVAQQFVRGASRLGRAGDLVEASRNLAAGAETLASSLAPGRANTDLAEYLKRGETVAVWLEGTKAMVQVATGTAGMLGSLVLGMGTTVAMAPLSVWVSVGSVAIATLDVIIYVKSGGDSPVDEFLEYAREARAKQFQLEPDGRIRLPDEPPPEPPEDRRHYHPPPHPASDLAKHIAGLHALVHVHTQGRRHG